MNPQVGELYNNPVQYNGGQHNDAPPTEAVIIQNTVEVQQVGYMPPAGYYRGQPYNAGFNPSYDPAYNGYRDGYNSGKG
jgi:hypothetical protein